MATFEFRLPDIGEGIAEAEIVAWHVKVGDMVKEDGRLADLMTDKATVEMESPVAGKVLSESGELTAVVTILHDRREALERARLFEGEARYDQAIAEWLEKSRELSEVLRNYETTSTLPEPQASGLGPRPI